MLYFVKYTLMKIELLFLTFLIGIFNSSVFAQSKIYATTSQGGAYDGGVLYELTTDGSSFANVYDFVIDKPAINPQYSELTQATDGNLYGVSPLGGENSAGVIFKYDPLTTSYAAVHEFSSASGSKPYGKLTLGSDGLLYGMTSAGGTNNVGVIFTFDFATNTYTKVFDFGTSNGTNPYGYLLEESAGVFYGMTSKGGVNNLGVIFKYDVITSTFTKIIDFKTYTGSQAFLSSGANPFGGFVKATNGLLYALSYAGGLYNLGAIFTFNPATNSMVKLIDLTNSHGTKPYGSFFKASNNKLYALNSGGGLNTQGSLISIDPTTGNTFARLVDFSAANGIAPNGSVLQAANGKLYGTTTMGGTNNLGVVFSYDIAMASVTKEFDFSTATGNLPSSTFIQASDGLLYTITNKGGNNAAGTIVSYNTATSTLNTLVHLNQANTGSYPYSGLVLVGNTTLYGMTPKGGVNGKGTLYSLLTGSNTYTKIIDFNGTNGANPYGSLIKGINGKLYGMTSQGGTNDLGTIFEFNTSTNTLTTLYSFSAANGSYPFGELVEYAAGVFYGMSRSGGTNSKGTLFSYNNNTSVFSKLIDFDGINYGANPYGALLKSLNGKLYGLTYSGGANSKGVLFSFNPTGSVFTKHVDFNGTDGSNPYGTLVETSIGQLYGLTYFGGTTNKGSLFGYNVAAGILTKYVNFNGANGSFPYGSLLVHSNDTLYGMTYSGGTSSKGTVFSYVESETSVTLLKSFAGTDGAYPLYSTAVVAPCVAAAAPASINGLSTVCQMSLGESYSVALVPGIGSYSWVVSDDATIVSGQGTSTITINFGMASPTISVYAISPCDTSIATTLLVTTVPPAAPATPGVITGLSNICSIGTTNTTYSIAAVLNASDYIWSITNGATIIGGQGTTAITVSFPDAAEAFSISVKAANSCDTSAANTLNVTDTILNAGLISGPDYYCSGSGTGTYSITAVANASGYEWSVPTGITITAGQGTTSIDISVDAAFVGGFIKVFAYNGCDSTAFSSKAIGSLTSEPDSIYGDQMVCSAGTSPVTYFINSIVGASSYQWIMPVGATILSGQGDTLITVSFTNMFVNGFIYVYSVSGCGNSDSASLFVSDIPFEIETISGPTSVCSLGTSNVTYTASASTGASSFNWSYPSNVNYVSGQGTSTLVVNFQSSFSSGTLSVQGINGCGFSDTTSLTVYRKPAKVDTIIGPRNVCGYASTTVVTYTASAVAGATAYQWVTGSGITMA